ncbi:MAG: PAS domain-containing protein [Minwuia sp.]|nr:PAS domain-containing protein [Minwuia sp.]
METQVFKDPDESAMGSAILLRLLRYWRRFADHGRLPSRTDIAPADMIPLLPWLLLVDVVGPDSYRYRLVGTGIVEHVGFDATGMDVGEAYPGADWSTPAKDYRYVMQERKPVLTITSALMAEDDPVPINYRRLLLPLARDGENVDMFLGAVQFAD